MALSTGLIRRLTCATGDEPLTKRLRLAENVFYSPDLPIVHKEDCIFRWLCNELSDKNTNEIWITIHRCLALEPKNFARLSSETQNLLTEELISSLNEFPERQVLEEMLNCCTYIFSGLSIQSCAKENKVIYLIEALITFTSKVLCSDNLENDNKFTKSDLALECMEQAICSFTQICKQNFSEKRNCMIIFIEDLLFPLASLVEIIKIKKISSKVVIETQKCIKRLLLGSMKNIPLSTNEKIEETEILFDTLKKKISTTTLEDVKVALTCLFQCAVNTFQQNSALIDIILRKLVECIEQKEQSKKVLISLLQNSTDVSYNFDHEINGVTLISYLKTQIENIISKKKRLKYSDYELLSATAKLNPLIVEDITQDILNKVLFENKTSEKEEIAHENLIKELWKASVRLRRQHKFLPKYLLAVTSYKEKEIEDLEFRSQFDLRKEFVSEFSEDLKSRTTSAQILAIFNTLIFHLKSDCIGKLKTSSGTTQVCLLTKIVTKFLVIFFEQSNFLDSSLPQDWQVKFYNSFTDFRNILALFSQNLCEITDEHEEIIFVAFSNVIKIWCETYDLLHYYVPNIVSVKLEFPVNESQLKELKRIIKSCRHQNCEKSLNQILLFKSIIYDRNNQQIKEMIITQLWPEILENHFENIESFDEIQILKLTKHLVNEASSTQENLVKWSSVLEKNVPRMTKMFTTSVALQIISNIVEDSEICATRIIVEKTDLEKILKVLDDPKNLKKTFKGANKEIAKQDFKSLNTINFSKIKYNLTFLSNLPLSFLDANIRTYLFMILYTFEKETKSTTDLKEFVTNLYLEFLRQNDIDVLNCVTKPPVLIDHFKDNQLILLKIFKLSLTSLSAFIFWEDFIDEEECSRKISSMLLTCVDSSKSKVSSNEHKIALQNLALQLSSKILKELHDVLNDSDEISGLRISLKIALLEKTALSANLKKCVELTLKNVVQNMETVIDHSLIQENLQLSLISLSHRENFDIDKEVIQKLCIILINNPDEKIFSHFLEVLKDNEFEFFAKSFSNQTKVGLLNGDVQVLEKLITIWKCLSKAEAKAIRSKSLCNAVNNLFNDLLASEIKEISSVFLLRICRALVTSKRMIRLSDRIVDSIFVTSMQSLNKLNKDAKLITCQEALGLCLDFLRSRTDFLLDRLPALTALFRKIVQIVLQEAKETNFSDEQMLRILAVDIEKFCTFFAKLKKDVVRISPYLIADLIEVLSRVGVLPSFLKVSIDSSMFHLLSNCDRHAISFLSRTLPKSMQQVFKTVYDNYVKYHKFTGKI